MFYIQRVINRQQNHYKALFDKGYFDIYSYNVYGKNENKRISCQIRGYADKEAYELISNNPMSFDNGQILDLNFNYKYSEVFAHEHDSSEEYDEMMRKLIMTHIIETEPDFDDAIIVQYGNVASE